MRTSHLSAVPSAKPNHFKRLVNAIHSWDKPDVITLYARDDEGRLLAKEAKAEHVCFVRDSEMTPRIERTLRESKYVEGMIKVEGHWRIRWKSSWDLVHLTRHPNPKLPEGGFFYQHGIETLEADVDPVRRYLTDNDVSIAKPLRCYIDLETDSRKGIVEAKNGNARILSWAIVDDVRGLVASGLLKEDTDECERELLMAFWRKLEPFDQVCAWNGDWFDFPVLEKRSKRLRVKANAARFLWLDHLEAFRKMNLSASKSGDEKQSLALDKVAKSLGLSGKTEGVDGSKTWELWETNPDLLLEYNENDTILEAQIEKKTKYLEQLYALCSLSYTFPDSRGMKPTRQAEGLVMKLGSKQGMRFPNRAQLDESDTTEGAKYDGAYRMEPDCDGIEKDVHVCDFSGMYPHNILSFNLSIETVRGRQAEPNAKRPSYMPRLPDDADEIPAGHAVVPLTRVVVAQEPRGILPQALDHCLALRAKYGAQKAEFVPGTPEAEEAERNDAACKAFVNGFYGVMGNIYSRFYNVDVAESTSQAGVWLIKAVIQAARNRGWKVIYGDTDSAFVSGCTNEEFSEFVAWCNNVLFPKILKERGCTRNTVKLAYEKKFKRLVMLSKSNYAGIFEHYKGKLATDETEAEAKGIDYKRGDGARLGRAMQKEVFDLILRKAVEDPAVYEAIIEKYKKQVLDEVLELKDFVLSQRITKQLKEYEQPLAHVEIAKVLTARGHVFRIGDKIDYIVIDGSDKLKTIPAIDYDPTKPDLSPDRFYLWERRVFPPSYRFLQAAFPKHDWSKHERVRPRYTRGVLPGQLGFDIGEAPAPPPRPKNKPQ